MQTLTPDPATAVERLQALGEETRLRIVQLLAHGERCVCELQAELDASQSRLSFHLRRLKDAGLVRDRKEGRWVYYALAPGALDDVGLWLQEISRFASVSRTRPDVCCL